MTTLTADKLRRENEELRSRLEEVEETLRAIQAGEVDAVVVESAEQQVYTLETPYTPYRLLVSKVPSAAVTVTVEGRIIACNSRFAALVHLKADSLRDRPLVDLVAPNNHPNLERLLRDGTTMDVEEAIVLLREDGVRVPAYLGISPLREGALGLCLMVTDLTDQRHYQELQETQAALRASEARYRSLFESIDEGFCVIQVLFDGAGRPIDYVFVETNPSFEQHTGLRDVLGRTMRELEPAHEDHWFRIYGKVAMTGDPIRFQNRAAALNRWYDVYAFRTGEPEDRKVAVLFNDITARKRNEDALKDADRNKDEFLAMLAHELRNPLAPISNAVKILKLKSPPVAELEWALGVIDRQVGLMARLLEDLLDVSRISRNQLGLRKEPVELTGVIEAALETSRPVIETRGQELIVALPPAPIRLRADPMRLAQVFANLLNNAAKYSEKRGRIQLTVEPRGGEVVVSVKDNGMGIPAEMLPRVFDIFSQDKSALARSEGGVGIGLSLVRGLVELHGGRVEARSDGLGRGSEFIVRLPVLV